MTGERAACLDPDTWGMRVCGCGACSWIYGVDSDGRTPFECTSCGFETRDEVVLVRAGPLGTCFAETGATD